MPVYTIIHRQTQQPIHRNAYTTATTGKEAFNNFLGKWKLKVEGIPSPRELRANIADSLWDIVALEASKPIRKERKPLPPEQLELF